MDQNSWEAQGVHVIETLKRIEGSVAGLHEKFEGLNVKQATIEKEMRVYSKVASAVAACLGFALSLLMELFHGRSR